jgi:hypothetical protein
MLQHSRPFTAQSNTGQSAFIDKQTHSNPFQPAANPLKTALAIQKSRFVQSNPISFLAEQTHFLIPQSQAVDTQPIVPYGKNRGGNQTRHD